MPIEPDLAEVIGIAIDSRMLDLHTMIVAKIVSYDASKQAAVVQPVVNGAAPNVDGSTTSETLPSIPNVPVRWERAGGYYDHKPLTAGDHGMLIFSESAFATWRTNGEVSDPGDLTRHGMSYAYFVPGAWPDAKALTDAPSSGEAVSIVPVGGHLRVSKAHGSADFAALAGLVLARLSTIQAAFDAHTHVVAGAAVVAGVTGTCSGTAAAPATPIGSLASVACTSLKAD